MKTVLGVSLLFTTLLTVFASAASDAASATAPIVIGSKIFTENYILAEIAAQAIENQSGANVSRQLGLGSTGLLFESLKSGAIDVYPEYSGTLAETILKKPDLHSLADLQGALEPLGLMISAPLGFDNTYALAVTESFAKAHHIESMSDLKASSGDLRAAFSYEFMDRKDGYRGMVERYHFNLRSGNVQRMEHSLVYRALTSNAVDVIEVYSTDANVDRYKLRLLKDDLHYFPAYEAVWITRGSFAHDHPREWQTLRKLEGSLSVATMREMNAKAEINKISFSEIAARFLGRDPTNESTKTRALLERTREHLGLVGAALLFAVFVGIPLGILAARSRFFGQSVLILSAVVQTIPALALLCFLIPLFGVGWKPAIVALCLYSLLPVVLNTFTGIESIDPKHVENAKAFGLTPLQILSKITLPLASPSILTGVKTSAIVSVGTATLAALIGAGGYGALIISGLSLNDIPMILSGAIPAAVMALLIHLAFDGLSKLVVPRGLRLKSFN